MKVITLHNYEAFILDFYEGNLDAVQTELLMDFLQNNPDCKADFDAFDNVKLEIEEAIFSGNEVLLSHELAFQSTISNDNFEEFSIAFHEGILLPEKEEELELFLATNPSYQSIHKIYSSVYLPQETIVFDQKKALLQQEPKIIYAFFKYAAVAAAIFWGVFLLNRPEQVYFYNATKPIAAVELNDQFDTFFENQVAVPIQTVKENYVKQVKELPVIKANPISKPTLLKMDKLEEELALAEVTKVVKIIDEVPVIKSTDIDIKVDYADQVTEVVAPNEKVNSPDLEVMTEYASLRNAALSVIKNDMLKNRPIIEALAEEITTATSDKIKITAKKGITKRIQEFALEIGEFSISKKY